MTRIPQNQLKTVLSLGCGLAALALTPESSAQAQNPATSASDVVVVTARKREEVLQDVPESITAFSSDEIKSAKIERLSDIAKLTPGLYYTPLFGAQNQLPIIRGASQSFGALNVGVFLDGIYLSGKAGVDLEVNDLARVEVVKGPQSALYGRNTFAGAINYITKRPGDKMSGQFEGTLGGDGLAKIVGSVEGPITDTLRFRLGGYVRHFDGWYRSAIDSGKVDFSDTSGVSGTLDWQPVQAFLATLRVSASTEDSGQPPSSVIRTNAFPGTPPGSSIPGVFTPTRNLLYMGAVPDIPENGVTINTLRAPYAFYDYGQNVQNIRTSLDLGYDFSGFKLSSMSAYAHRTDEYTFDGANTICDQTGGCPSFGYPFAPKIPANAANFALSSSRESYRDLSQELRLQSTSKGPLHWLVGAYYYDNKTSQFGLSRSAAYPYSGASAAFYGFPLIQTTVKSLAEFASLGYDVTDKLSASVELRHEDEKQTYVQAPGNPACATSTDVSCLVFNAPGRTSLAGVYTLPRLNFDFTTPRVIVNYKLTPENMLYASFSKGEKSGGFNSAANILSTQRTYVPEESRNYEIGSKNEFFNKTLLINVDAYYNDWYKQQIPCQNVLAVAASSTNKTYICTAGSSTVKGAELEWAWKVTPEFTFAGNYAYTDAEYSVFKDDTLQSTLALLKLPALNFDGKRLPYVPEHKLLLSPTYRTMLPIGWDLEARADISVQTKSYVRADNFQNLPGKSTTDLRLTFSKDALRVQLFVDNVFDDSTPVAAVRFYDATNYYVAAPLVTGANRRLAGVSLGSKF